MPKCAICRQAFKKMSMTHKVCRSEECAIAWAEKERAKKDRQEARLKARREAEEKREHRKKLEKLKSRSDWLKESQAVFNRYIRERDAKEACISCGKWVSTYDAGHFRSVGAAPQLRFHEDNCHKQCVRCNQHLSGNQLEYRIRLVQKIGVDQVEALENDQSTKKYTIDDLKAIKAHYRDKLKELKKKAIDNP